MRGGRTALDRHNMRRAVDGSLRRLETDYIDLYQTHWPDPDLPYDEVMEALDRAVQAGKVRYVGCSNETAYGLTKSLGVSDARGLARYETIQNNFSLLNRRFEDELANVCRREKVSLLPYSPIAGGVLTGKYQGGACPEARASRATRKNDQRGADHGAALRQREDAGVDRALREASPPRPGSRPSTLAVAWTLAHDFVGSTIIGATVGRRSSTTRSRAAEVKLSRETLAACDAVTREILYPMG